MSKAKYIIEGGSSNRPPFFDGSNYYFWKNTMQLFLKSQDTWMWHIITDKYFIPRVDQDDSTCVAKMETDWTVDDKNKVLINSKAQLFLSCTLSREQSERVDECTTTKEVWDTLQTHHEGRSHVKETRIDIGIRKFELFEMQERETIDEMYSRFTTIVNEMRSLGKAYTVQERVRKIMRCLPIIWRPMKDGGSVTFGNNNQAQIKGTGTISKTKYAQITDVQYVEGLPFYGKSIDDSSEADTADKGWEESVDRHAAVKDLMIDAQPQPQPATATAPPDFVAKIMEFIEAQMAYNAKLLESQSRMEANLRTLQESLKSIMVHMML
ncbi:uncharacterized protein [Cicer arietinum]|uniref:uncharacterized protein n=1 Tax=Cicer arietinum TaxID=3827 RepID=UPI003CC6AF60